MQSVSDYPDSYYVATAKGLISYPPLTESVKADVCVIGGGFTGLLTAVNLAERGYKVALLEANKIAWGASGRNGGQVGSGHNKNILQLESDYGKSLAQDFWATAEEAKSIVRNRIDQHQINCDLAPGSMKVSDNLDDADHFKRYVDKLNTDYDYEHITCLSEPEVFEMLHSPLFKGGGTLDMGGMHLHPLNYALGLAKAAKDAGADIYEHSRVINYSKNQPSTVSTENGQVVADHIVLACNAYLDKLERRIAGKIMPVNNFM